MLQVYVKECVPIVLIYLVYLKQNHLSDATGLGFNLWSDQIKDYDISIHCFSSKYAG